MIISHYRRLFLQSIALPRAGTALALLSLLSGCLGSDKEPVRTASSTSQVAAVLVSPTMVAPWSDVSNLLSPNFTMSGDAALAKVLPTTERVSTQVLNAQGFGLAVGLPGSSTTKSDMITSLVDNKSATDASGTVAKTSSSENSTSNTTTKSLTPGAAPTVPSGTPAGGALPTAMGNTGDLGVDPAEQAKAANSLNETYQLLNVEVQHAATRGCYVAFVTKFKLAVMPYRPNMGYDLHTRISFFRHGTNAAPQVPTQCTGQGDVPVVVPLLAADDLQMATKAKAVEEAQQIGLALSAMIHGVGASANFDKANQRLQAILNHDTSSSMTISQESENTLYVRIAAGNVASGQPALSGQTYDVAALVLVPTRFMTEAMPRLDVVDYTEFRDADSGEVLPAVQAPDVLKRANGVAEYFLRSDASGLARWRQLPDDDKLCATAALVQNVQSSNYSGFEDALDMAGANGATCMTTAGGKAFVFEDAAHALAYGHIFWTRMSAFLADESAKTSVLWLPTTPTIQLDQTTSALATDDGTQSTTTYLMGVTGYSAGSLMAHLAVEQPAVPKSKAIKASPAIAYSIPASSMSYDPTVEVLGITFPSIKKLGITPSAAPQSLVLEANACVVGEAPCPTLNGGRTPVTLAVQIATQSGSASTPAVFTLSSLSPTIVVEKDATGEAEIKLASLPSGETAVLSVSGAAVKAVHDSSGTAIALGSSGYTLPANGVYTVDFIDLTNAASAVFAGQEMKGPTKLGTTSLTVPVVDR